MNERQSIKPLIHIHGLSHTYGDKDILLNISLDVYQGDISILRGPSGSGKSTFLRIISGIDATSYGGVDYMGISTRDREFESFYRERIGVFFTDSVFFESSTARENIIFPSLFGGYGFSEDLFRTCIEVFGIDDILDTPVLRLSSGERERIAFVRMIVSAPDILILDEPFSHLDEGLYSIALEFLSDYIREYSATIWVVTHDRGFILPGAQEYRIEHGSIIPL